MKCYFSTLKPLITLVILTLFISCGNNPLDVDVSEIDVTLEVKRFDVDLFDTTLNKPENLNIKYGVFFQAFTEQVIRIGAVDHPSTAYQLTQFTSSTDILDLKKDVDQLYTDFSPYQKELETAFKHYKYYFPKRNIPEVVTYISGFNYAVITDVDYLGIGLDMFLGKDYAAYAQLGIPKYKANNMDKEHLVAGTLLGWISTEFELQDTRTDLLTEMIHQGKLLYLLDALLPHEEDFIKINYTREQQTWCENSNTATWFYFIDNDLLYTKETSEIIKYMGEAPFVQGFPEGSPGRIGHWQGWQIVKAYMKNNPTITIEQLMNKSNAQQILNDSKYKP
jgi:gliding motility-associated lipoprotein GldB